MPHSVRVILKKALHKGAITSADYEKVMRNVIQVRCKDCIHGIPTRIDTVTGEFSDERHCNRNWMCHFEDYYCADGKRKETDG